MFKFGTILATTALLMTPAALAQTGTNATATFINADGQEVGTVTLTQTADGVQIAGEVNGISPGEHAIHIHETGDCDPTTAFESAGGHFEPGEHQHGLENPQGPHAGDIPNQMADANGIFRIEATTARVTLGEGETSLFDADGSALVIHAGPDDNVTDPAGNSGDRVACAVIEAAAQ